MECPKPKFNDLSRSLVALGQDNTIIGAIELSRSSWLLGGVVPGLRRDPRKKLPPDADALLGLLHRWRDEAVAAGRKIERISLRTERRMRLFSQEGYMAVDFAARKLIMIGREGSVPRERGVPVPGTGIGRMEEIAWTEQDALAAEHEAFAAAVLDGAPVVVDAAAGRRALAVEASMAESRARAEASGLIRP